MSNENDQEFGNRIFQQFMDIFVIPEVKKRQDSNKLSKPLELHAAQIIFSPDGGTPQVRLNSEVRTLVKFKSSEQINAGDPIYSHPIEDIHEIQLTDEDDPDCGHATLIRIGEKWFTGFDFLYNKGSARRHSNAAKEFYEGAVFAKKIKYWSLCIDSLCSLSELAAKALLLSQVEPGIRKSKTHDSIHSKFNIQAKRGNVSKEHSDAFNKLWNLRSKARYLDGELNIKSEEVEFLLLRVKELIDVCFERVKTFE